MELAASSTTSMAVSFAWRVVLCFASLAADPALLFEPDVAGEASGGLAWPAGSTAAASRSSCAITAVPFTILPCAPAG